MNETAPKLTLWLEKCGKNPPIKHESIIQSFKTFNDDEHF